MSSENKIFKVYFQGSPLISAEGLNLSFFGFDNDDLKIPQFSEFLIKYNDMSRKKKVFSINNIKEVISLGKADKSKLNQFFVLLYSYKNPNNPSQRAGILIGNHKEKGFLMLGLWPYNSTKGPQISIDNFISLFQMIVQKNEKFEDLLLIS